MLGSRALRPVFALGALMMLSAAAAPLPRARVLFHTKLEKSEPAANDTLSKPPREIRLWYSEPVEIPITRVKLTNSAGTAFKVSAPSRMKSGNDESIVVSVSTTLKAGSYVIHWSTAAADGHPAKGTIAFVVQPKP